LTLQFTAVLEVFVTVAVNVVGLPSSTETLAGLTHTTMAAGGGIGGGGAIEDALPLLQPIIQRLCPRRIRARIAEVPARSAKIGERDRMASQKQAKDQRKGDGAGSKEKRVGRHLCREETYLNERLEAVYEATKGGDLYRREKSKTQT
jgi:hypothetical protein